MSSSTCGLSMVRCKLKAWKRTGLIRFVRGLIFDGSAVKRAELRVWQFITDNVGTGWICLDVGANRGEFSCLMAKQVGPSGQVYSFELNPDNTRLLRSNLWRYWRRVTVENIAISDGTLSELGMYPGPNRSGAEWSVLGEGVPELLVMATSLDRYVGGKRVDLVKIDVEGAGDAVLRGMTRTLSHSRPLLIMELHNEAEWKALQAVGRRGYRLIVLDETGTPDSGTFGRHVVAVPDGRIVKLFSAAS